MTIDMMSDSFHNDTTDGIEGFANASVGKLELFFDEQEASLNRNIDLNASLREFGAVTSPDLPGCLAIRKLAGCGRLASKVPLPPSPPPPSPLPLHRRPLPVPQVCHQLPGVMDTLYWVAPHAYVDVGNLGPVCEQGEAVVDTAFLLCSTDINGTAARRELLISQAEKYELQKREFVDAAFEYALDRISPMVHAYLMSQANETFPNATELREMLDAPGKFEQMRPVCDDMEYVEDGVVRWFVGSLVVMACALLSFAYWNTYTNFVMLWEAEAISKNVPTGALLAGGGFVLGGAILYNGLMVFQAALAAAEDSVFFPREWFRPRERHDPHYA